MKVPYILNTDKRFTRRSVGLHDLPEWCEYPLAFATLRTLYTRAGMELQSQQLNHRFFFINLLQLRTDGAVHIPFEIFERQLFLYFSLRGAVSYLTEKHRPIVHTVANSFLMSYFDKGRYFAHTGHGIHTALVVSILPRWIEGISHDYPNLQDILRHYRTDSRPYDTMYQSHIDRRIRRWLYKIYSYSQNNPGALDGNLQKYISYLLGYYDSEFTDSTGDISYKIKAYIQEHFRDNELSVRFLEDHFSVSGRTLLNNFKRRYHQSIQEYISGMRISYALKLMAEQGLGIKDVYMEAGYKDERSFRYALDRYRKHK